MARPLPTPGPLDPAPVTIAVGRSLMARWWLGRVNPAVMGHAARILTSSVGFRHGRRTERRMTRPRRLLLGLSVDGLGHDPQAWRADGAAAGALFTGRALVRHVQGAERAGLDFVTLGDAFGLQPGGADVVRGRLDALLAMAMVAPLTQSIGLVPVIDTTHTEPFHVAKNVATLDIVSHGRAGWWPQVSTAPRRSPRSSAASPPRRSAELWAEADEVVDVVRAALGQLGGRRRSSATSPPAATSTATRSTTSTSTAASSRCGARRSRLGSPQGQPLVVRRRERRGGAGGRGAGGPTSSSCEPRTQAAAKALRDDVAATGASVRWAQAGRRRPSSSRSTSPWRRRTTPPSRPPSPSRWRIGRERRRSTACWCGRRRLGPVLPLLAEVVVPVLAGQGLRPSVPDAASLRDRFGLDRPPSRYAVAT